MNCRNKDIELPNKYKKIIIINVSVQFSDTTESVFRYLSRYKLVTNGLGQQYHLNEIEINGSIQRCTYYSLMRMMPTVF